MRQVTMLALGAALCSSATAQNLFEIYPDAAGTATSYTSRFSLGIDSGELHQEIHEDLFERLGDVTPGGFAPLSRIVGVRYTTQDQDASSQEFYWLVLRRANAGGFPPGPGPLIYQHPTLLTPLDVAGPKSWTLTINFAAPITVPNDTTWYMGVRLPNEAGWPADGQSMHCAAYYTNPRGDFPRGTAAAPAPNHTWQIDAAGVVAMPATPRVMRMGALTSMPVLNAGTVNAANVRQLPAGSPCYGAGGSYPDVLDDVEPRYDDLALRVRAIDHAGGIAFLYGCLVRGAGVKFFGVEGTLALNPALMFGATSPAIGGGGIAESILAFGPATSAVRAALLGIDLHFQAVVIDAGGGNPQFSNLATVRF